MKTKILFAAAVMMIVTGAMLSSCSQPSDEKVKDANEDVAEKRQELNQAETEAMKEWEQFKIAANEKISENEAQIEKFKAKMENASAKSKEKYREKIADLEAKNRELKRKLDEYKYESETNWQEFKREFNHDMDELGHAISDLFKDNTN